MLKVFSEKAETQFELLKRFACISMEENFLPLICGSLLRSFLRVLHKELKMILLSILCGCIT